MRLKPIIIGLFLSAAVVCGAIGLLVLCDPDGRGASLGIKLLATALASGVGAMISERCIP